MELPRRPWHHINREVILGSFLSACCIVSYAVWVGRRSLDGAGAGREVSRLGVWASGRMLQLAKHLGDPAANVRIPPAKRNVEPEE